MRIFVILSTVQKLNDIQFTHKRPRKQWNIQIWEAQTGKIIIAGFKATPWNSKSMKIILTLFFVIQQ